MSKITKDQLEFNLRRFLTAKTNYRRVVRSTRFAEDLLAQDAVVIAYGREFYSQWDDAPEISDDDWETCKTVGAMIDLIFDKLKKDRKAR